MKKIKLIINLIYIFSFLLVGGLTIFFIAKGVKEGASLYFQEKKPPQTPLLFSQKEINEVLDLLQKYKVIK